MNKLRKPFRHQFLYKTIIKIATVFNRKEFSKALKYRGCLESIKNRNEYQF